MVTTPSLAATMRPHSSAETLETALQPPSSVITRPELPRHLSGMEMSTLIPKKRVLDMLGKSNGWLYNKLNPRSKYFDPTFPRQIRLSKNGTSVAWVLQEVVDWIQRQVARSREDDIALAPLKDVAK